jgi:hypothetical protein
VIAILATLAGGGMSLITLVMLMAGGANSSPKQVRELKIMMLCVLLLAMGSLVGAIWTFIKERYGLSALIGVAPAIACIALIAWMVITEY